MHCLAIYITTVSALKMFEMTAFIYAAKNDDSKEYWMQVHPSKTTSKISHEWIEPWCTSYLAIASLS